MADLLMNIVAEDKASDAFESVTEHAGNLKEMLDGALKGALGSTVTTFSSLETAAEKAAEKIKEFAQESIEEYAKAEQAHRQLAAVAGELTEQFEEQAKAIGNSFAVKDEDIEKMQMLLLRYGAAPNVIGDATQAVLNYAAATGTDAHAAMMMLIRGVESGHGTLGRMGVQFDATGDQAHDFAAAVQALNEKFGGAGALEAEGLAGRTRAASIAFDELKKTVGGFLALLEEKTGTLATFTGMLKGLTDVASGNVKQGLTQYALAGVFGIDASKGGAVPTVQGEGKGSGVDLGMGDITLEQDPKKAAAWQRSLDESLARFKEHNEKMLREEDDFDLKQAELEQKAREQQEKAIDESTKLMEKAFVDQQTQHTKDLQQLGEMQFNMLEQETKKQEQEAQKREALWFRLGERIGSALIGGLTAMIQSQGKNNSQWVWALGETIVGVIGIISPWAGALLKGGMALGQGLGEASNYGGTFGGQGLSEISSSFAAPISAKSGSGGGIGVESDFSSPFHDGGWIPRFHSGGGFGLAFDERMAILQTGERVLSRREVGAMGGPAGVDAAARGHRVGANIVVQAIDAQSVAAFFGEGHGQRAMINDIRTNRGPLRLMFGAG